MRLFVFHILMVSLFLPFAAFAQTARPQAIPSQTVPAAYRQQNWCVPKNTPNISIKTDTDRITWIYSKSEKVLNKADIDTINPYASNVITDVGGLMSGGIKMEEAMNFGSLVYGGQETCMFYNSIDISFHIFPTIYIASEYLPGTCMHNAIKAHELKHINTDRWIVNKYAQLVGKAVQAEIRRQNIYGPVPIANKDAIQSQMKERMGLILRQYSDAMDAERRRLQQNVDSLQEYERVNHLCDKR